MFGRYYAYHVTLLKNITFMTPAIHIGEEIQNHLALQQRSIAWLAKQLCYDPSNLRKLLKHSYLTTDLLYRISIILGKDFFACYSQMLMINNGSVANPCV